MAPPPIPASKATGHPEEQGGLGRRLGLADVVAIHVGNILGSGIFVAPAAVAAAVPGSRGAWLWAAGGLIAACGAVVYAECGTRLPRSGGFYVTYRAVYGEAVAFVGGWAALLVTYPASIAAIALIFASYLGEIVPAAARAPALAALGALAVVAFINASGVRLAAWTQRILTAAKISALAAVCLAALFAAGSTRVADRDGPREGADMADPAGTRARAAHRESPREAVGDADLADARTASGIVDRAGPPTAAGALDRAGPPAASESVDLPGPATFTPEDVGERQPPLSWAVLLGAFVIILWTYDGWSDISMVSGEVRDPRRVLGRAVLLGTTVLVAVYALVQVAVGRLLAPQAAAGSDRVLAEAVEAGLGGASGNVVALLVVLATFGSIHGIVLAASRLGWAMARDGVFFRWFGGVSPARGTPARAIFVLAAVSGVYVLVSGFRNLLGLFSFTVWIFYGLTAAGLLILRRRRIGEAEGGRITGSAAVPAILILTGAAMSAGLFVESPGRSLAGLGLLAAGFPAYVLWRRLSGYSGPAGL